MTCGAISGWLRRVPQPAKMPRRSVGGLFLRNPNATMVRLFYEQINAGEGHSYSMFGVLLPIRDSEKIGLNKIVSLVWK